ncbi:MAG: PIN domain-containing protein [Verrucomicrobia bacterium]|nr:PIN domain-containing protein [Verrucomicrobiota bacterium]
MAASPVLADSSFYIRLMREKLDPLRALSLAAATRDVATCGIVRVEVGRAILPLELWKKFQAAWSVMIYVHSDNRLWEEVEAMAWQLDRSGVILPLPDLVIACCAKRIGAVVLTFDGHFQQIPGVRAVSELDY